MRTLLISLILLTGCAAPKSAPTPDNSVRLDVTSSAFSPVKVYQVVGTTHERLDLVNPGRSQSLRLVTRPDHRYIFYVVPFAEREGTYLGPVQAQPGDHITLNIQEYLPLSMFSVHP